MNELIDFLTSNTTLAYITAVIIFIVTLVLMLRRLIGVVVFAILLVFALLSGLSVANHDLFREILTSFKYEPEKFKEDTFTHYKNQIKKAFEEIKEEFGHQAEKAENLYENYNTPSDEELKKPSNNL